MLLFAPVNVSIATPAATSTVTLPPADGVISTVKTGLPEALKLLALPLPTLISPTTKPFTDSLNVMVTEKGELFVGSLSLDDIDTVKNEVSYLMLN